MKKSNRKSVSQSVETPIVEQVNVDLTPTVETYVDVSVDPVDPVDTVIVENDPIVDEPKSIAQLRSDLVFIVNNELRNDAHWSMHRETRAGIPIPRGTGLCYTAWCLFDVMYSRGIIDTATIVETGFTVYALNRGNLRTEISRYRKYHGYIRPVATKVTVATV